MIILNWVLKKKKKKKNYVNVFFWWVEDQQQPGRGSTEITALGKQNSYR